MDAFECPPTFGYLSDGAGVIAGEKSSARAVEENEDTYEEGRLAIQETE